MLRNGRRRPNASGFRLRLAALVWCIAFLGLGVLEARDGQDELGEIVDVTEVLVDVVVTDRKGQVVLGLDSDDFVIRENGDPVEVVDVTFYSNRRFLGSSALAEDLQIDTVPENRYFSLCCHHQRNLLPRLAANLLDAGRRAKQWVMSSLLPNDYVAVASYFPKLNVLDFTNDPDLLAATIDLAVQGKDFRSATVTASSGIPSLTGAMPSGDVDRIHEALAMVAEGAGAVRGRKNLVLYSIGFGQLSSFGFFLPDQRYYPPTVETLNDNHVSVYPVDLLAIDLSPSLVINRASEVLSALAHDTAGQFFFNFNNYMTPLERIASDNNGYYLLSYRSPQPEAETDYRRVEVETLDTSFDVRHREGYVPGSGYPYGDRVASGR